MSGHFRKLTLGVLYIAVALLIAVPPVAYLATARPCDAPPCTLSSRQLFTLDAALIWLLPFSIAAVLVAVAFRIRNRP